MRVFLLFEGRHAHVFAGPREDSSEGWLTFFDDPLPPVEATAAWNRLAHVLRRIAAREDA